jgi:hypothetical protein
MKTLTGDERKRFYKRLLLASAASIIVTLTLSLSSCLGFGLSGGYGQDWNSYDPYPGDSYWGDQYRPMQGDGPGNRITPNRQYRPTGANRQNRQSSQHSSAGQLIKDRH